MNNDGHDIQYLYLSGLQKKIRFKILKSLSKF